MQKMTTTSAIGRQIRRNDGNCFLWGCATLALVLVLGSLVAGFTFRYVFQQAREKYTDDEPIDLPVVEMEREELDALIDRVDAFEQGLRDDEPVEALVLTQKDLNALFQHHPELTHFAGRVYVTIEEDDVLTGQVSVPLDFFPGLGGRYFNGSATFDAAIEDGRFTVFVVSATLKGEPVPETFMDGLRGENLAKDLHSDPDTKELIDKIERLEIKDGTITITPANLKKAPAEGAAAESVEQGANP